MPYCGRQLRDQRRMADRAWSNLMRVSVGQRS